MLKFTQRIFAGHNQEFPLWNSKVPPFPENLQTLDGKTFHQRCNLWNLPQHYISQPTAQSWSNNLETSLCQNRLYPSELWNIVTEPSYNISQRFSRFQQSCQVRIKREKSNNINNHTLSRLLLVWAVWRIRIRRIHIISLDPDQYQKMAVAGSGIRIHIKWCGSGSN